jgi:phage baseplate assembly protein W
MDLVNRDFLGAGWAFPVGLAGGGIALAEGERAIERSIRIILSTARGERRMRPQFGCGIHDLVFEPNNPTTHALIRSRVAEALAWWEPRIEIGPQDVAVQEEVSVGDRSGAVALLIHIRYRVRVTNAERNLVYPFYLIPGEE